MGLVITRNHSWKSNSNNDVKRFCEAVFAGHDTGYFEVRTKRKNRVYQDFFPTSFFRTGEQLYVSDPSFGRLADADGTANVYVSALPRCEHRGRKDAVREAAIVIIKLGIHIPVMAGEWSLRRPICWVIV